MPEIFRLFYLFFLKINFLIFEGEKKELGIGNWELGVGGWELGIGNWETQCRLVKP